MKSAEATRVTLMARLSAAAGLLLGYGHKDSHAAILEAQEVIRALPFADDINAALYNAKGREAEAPMLMGGLQPLRELRQYHYDQFIDLSNRANEQQKKSDGRLFSASSRDAFEKVAHDLRARANRHLRFVRSLNDFFPANERIK